MDVKCAYCGKKFTINGGWGYAYGGMYTCSYHCMRAMRAEDLGLQPVKKPEEKMEEEKKTKRGGPREAISEETRRIIIELYENGQTCKEISERVGLDYKTVYNFCYRHGISPQRAQEKPPETAKECANIAKNCAKTEGKCAKTEEKCANIAELNIEPVAAERIDPARLILAICDAIELLKMLLDDWTEKDGQCTNSK